MRITPKTLQRLHVLLSKTGLMETKGLLVQQYSGRRATSSKDLTEAEGYQLCQHLETQPGGQPPPAAPEERDPANEMRRKLFHLAHSLGWETHPGGPVDKARLFGWVEKYGSLKKPLMAYKASELPALVTQLEQVHRSFILGVK